MKFSEIDTINISGTEFRVVREYDDMANRPLINFYDIHNLANYEVSNLRYREKGDIRVLAFECKNKYTDIWVMENDSVKISDIGYDEHMKIGVEPKWFITISRVFEHTLLWYGSTGIHTQKKHTAHVAFINNNALIGRPS